MIPVTLALAAKVVLSIKKSAEAARTDAAYGGRWDDGGASRMEKEADIFMCGLRGEWPSGWEYIAQKIINEHDPDYQLYLKLKERFEK